MIKVEDEGKFLDLIEDLGLEIIDEDQKVSAEVFENSQEQKEEKTEKNLNITEIYALDTMSETSGVDILDKYVHEIKK